MRSDSRGLGVSLCCSCLGVLVVCFVCMGEVYQGDWVLGKREEREPGRTMSVSKRRRRWVERSFSRWFKY